MTDAVRHTAAQLDAWRRDGACLFEGFFQAQELEGCVADMELLYGDRRPSAGEARADARGQGSFAREQFLHIDNMPFECSPALNLIALHPALIELARAALGTDAVHLYQSHSWAKFTGDADYDQAFHCDFLNHTLTVPAEAVDQRTINFVIYFTDVSDDLGAVHYVPLTDSDLLLGGVRVPFCEQEQQRELRARERSGAGPVGSVFAYGIDVFHRGTNLTRPGGCRYTLTASYKAAGNDQIGWSAWPHSFQKPWHLLFEHATPEQLACLGVPAPGHPFWTPVTIDRTQRRWPAWNASAYRAALAVS